MEETPVDAKRRVAEKNLSLRKEARQIGVMRCIF